MTVEDIKDYITQKINYYKDENYYHTLPTNTVLLDFEQIGIMLDQLDEQKTSIDDITNKMRPATKEELEGIDEYIKGISIPIDNEWVRVDDRLPTEDKNNKYQEYYITIHNELNDNILVDEAYFINGEWQSVMGELDYDLEIKNFENVIAWKYKNIPEPYRKSDENE